MAGVKVRNDSTADEQPAWRRWLRRAGRIAAIAIIYLLVFDAVAWLGLKLAGYPPPPSDPAVIYPGASWAPELFDEMEAVDVVWSPYCYWRSTPLDLRYFHVDANGLRRTWSGGAPRVSGVNPRRHRVLMFGGSTMFGIDARDDYTIPSLFAKDLQHADLDNVEVINYGQVGYVSTQEVISFLLALRDDPRPDLVVFYDGFNDAGAAYEQQQAGITVDEKHRALEFDLLNHTLRRGGGRSIGRRLKLFCSSRRWAWR